jgi:hypothetical protein
MPLAFSLDNKDAGRDSQTPNSDMVTPLLSLCRYCSAHLCLSDDPRATRAFFSANVCGLDLLLRRTNQAIVIKKRRCGITRSDFCSSETGRKIAPGNVSGRFGLRNGLVPEFRT